MWYYYHRAMHYAESLESHEWFLVLAGVVVIGVVCMRGFGSRNKY